MVEKKLFNSAFKFLLIQLDGTWSFDFCHKCNTLFDSQRYFAESEEWEGSFKCEVGALAV